MLRVKELQIDRLRVIFNKLSVTVESQTTAVNSLLEKIIVSNNESPEFLKYTLFKIANNIVNDCQEEFFNEMDEGHPLKLARIACGLCANIREGLLADLIKAQFYSTCPLCIPKAAEGGLTGDQFLQDMGFRRQSGGGSGGGWEGKSQWLARMSKLLCTFCVIMIQPEQHPLSLADAWSWLAQLVNMNAAAVASAKQAQAQTQAQAQKATTTPLRTAPFFTATALEVMLRVTGQALHRAYGSAFLSLLSTLQSDLLPALGDSAPRAAELQKFLTQFIKSGGTEFMSLFNKPVSN
jgi:hypothetical protein